MEGCTNPETPQRVRRRWVSEVFFALELGLKFNIKPFRAFDKQEKTKWRTSTHPGSS